MNGSVYEALRSRRSCYDINDKSPISEEMIREVLEFTLLYVPSAFNSQSARLVLLLGDHYKRFWNIVFDELQKVTPAESLSAVREKVNAFASGCGTVLFYEDMAVVEKLQDSFSKYRDKFPEWSAHASGMHQLVVWTLLEDAGFGASLQHYNPLIDERVREAWNIDPKWRLIAQMPFGGVVSRPDPKEKLPMRERLFIFS